jgi:pentalenolactone synthase
LFDYGEYLVAASADPGDASSPRVDRGVGDDRDRPSGDGIALRRAQGDGRVHRLWRHRPFWPTTSGTSCSRPELILDAVEEILRIEITGGAGIPRYARADTRIGDVTVRAGELVLLDIGAANHDPTVFTDPDRFDPTRHGAPHLAFGHGARYCIGAPLARIELHAVFSQLVPRFPAMALTVPLDHLQIHDNLLAGGLVELAVTW